MNQEARNFSPNEMETGRMPVLRVGERDFLFSREAAAELGVSERTLGRLVLEREIESYKVGHGRRFRKAAVREYQLRRTVAARPGPAVSPAEARGLDAVVARLAKLEVAVERLMRSQGIQELQV